MKQGRFSRTADKVAIRRAAHQLFDQPRVLDDALPSRLSGRRAPDPPEDDSFRFFVNDDGFVKVVTDMQK